MGAVVVGTVRRLGAKEKVDGQRGLPKPALPFVTITARGLDGDYNLYRATQRGGDPEMAVLLIPEETLAQLNAEGWPVQPGDLGENVTLAGILYASLEPPRDVRLGDAIVRTAKPCTPCDNLYALPYVGRERGPEFVRTLLGRRGWFATVLRPGTVRTGDRVEVTESEERTAAPAVPSGRPPKL